MRLLCIIALAVACAGCANVDRAARWHEYERGIRNGRYELRETRVWYKGRWVRVLDPRWTPEVKLPTPRGPRA